MLRFLGFNKPYKLGLSRGDGHRRFQYGHHWMVQETTGPQRLVIAPAAHHVDFLLDAARALPEPFRLLHVLLQPRGHSGEAGRYASPPLSRTELSSFLDMFRDYLECDGRQALWLQTAAAPAALVYDQHNLIYAYGPAQLYIELARKRGLSENKVTIPYPHVHCYHPEFDAAEREVMGGWQWTYSPLEKVDDDD